MLIIQKFGGTSVATVELIQKAAHHVIREASNGAQMIVVVSAMAGTTDQLVSWASTLLSSSAVPADYDTVLAAGEQITSGLLALALQQQGLRARSWQGWQIPIETTNHHGHARILNIHQDRLRPALAVGEIIVVPGFQGITEDNLITTLGRGGSDTTAVALAAAFDAEWCDIYTDVDGVYTADPRLVPKVRKIDTVSYEVMLEMAAQGAKVLHPRAVEIALQHQVKLRVLSSFMEYTPTVGTWIMKKDALEYSGVVAVASVGKLAQLRLVDVTATDVGQVLSILESCNGTPDLVQCGGSELSFVVPEIICAEVCQALKAVQLVPEVVSDLAKVSLIGVGLARRPYIMNPAWRILQREHIPVYGMVASETAYSFLIPMSKMACCIRQFHATYDLGSIDEN